MVILGDVLYDSERCFQYFVHTIYISDDSTYTFLTVTLDMEPFSMNAFTSCVL